MIRSQQRFEAKISPQQLEIFVSEHALWSGETKRQRPFHPFQCLLLFSQSSVTTGNAVGQHGWHETQIHRPLIRLDCAPVILVVVAGDAKLIPVRSGQWIGLDYLAPECGSLRPLFEARTGLSAIQKFLKSIG